MSHGDALDGVLKPKFYANIGLPLVGMITDVSGKAAQKRVAEYGARGSGARGRPAQFRAQGDLPGEQVLDSASYIVGKAIVKR